MTSAILANYLLQTSLSVSVLIGLVLFVRRPLARYFGARAAYALWAIPLLRLVLPPLPEGWTLFGSLNLFGQNAELASLSAPPETHIVFTSRSSEWLTATPPALPYEPASLWQSFMSAIPDGPFLALLIWGAGTLIVMATLIYRQWVTARLISAEARPAGPKLQTLAVATAQSIGLRPDQVRVETSFISSGPLVCGLVNPVILLPAWFDEDYTAEEQALAITHELMHIRRRDLWALLAASFVFAAQWFNPLVWFGLAAFRVDQEAACDADVLDLEGVSPRNYGAALLKAVRVSAPVAQPLQAASLPLNHALIERITQMKAPIPSPARRRAGLMLTAGFGAAAVFVSACAVSNAQTSDGAAELEGGTEAPIVTETRTEEHVVIFESEPAETDLSGLEDGAVRMRIITRSDGGGLEGKQVLKFRNDAEGAGSDSQTAIFIFGHGNEELGEAARKFAKERARLERREGDHSAEIAALEKDFEAQVEALTGAGGDVETDVRILSLSEEDSWIGTTDTDVDCESGKVQRKNIVIQRDGEREERSITLCGMEPVVLDLDTIMSDLRANGDLSEARLAEIEAKLAEAQAQLAEMGNSFEFREHDGDIEVEVITKTPEAPEPPIAPEPPATPEPN